MVDQERLQGLQAKIVALESSNQALITGTTAMQQDYEQI